MIAVIDTETTGLDPATASIVELAIVTLPGFDSFSTIVKPSHPIELEAMAAHHLTEEVVAEGAPFEDAIVASMIQQADFIAAHNAAFDSGFVKIDKPWICTYRCARQLWPDAPRHSNQVLRYYLGLNDQLYTGDGKKIMELPPHRALPDAWVTAHILYKMLLTNPPESLVALTKEPILIKTCGFGKHRGVPWEEVPKSYMSWMLQQKPGFDDDTVFTIKHHLGLV